MTGKPNNHDFELVICPLFQEVHLNCQLTAISKQLKCRLCHCRRRRNDVDGYVYNKDGESKLLMTGNWSTSMSYQPCDAEGEPIDGTELKEVCSSPS